MTLTSKEHYDLIENFEREFKGCGRFDKEAKEFWAKGCVYQHGQVNQLFLAYRRGYALGTAVAA
jgi:hypothetical protein